jgi:hypothetical protein
LSSTLGISFKLKYSIWAATVCLWLAEALAARGPLDADLVSYLDIARSCLTGNWQALLNGYWSPGYPLLLALWIKITHVSRFHDALAVHLFGFISLIVALVCFEYFLSVFFAFRARNAVQTPNVVVHGVPDHAVWSMGYSLFFWITTFFTPPWLEHPDILVFIAYLVASALCMQLSDRQEWWRYGLLGIVLGLGYLAKAVMFPLGFVFLLALFLQRAKSGPLPRLIFSAAVFLAIALPFCLALSQSKGRFTFGDVGAIAYRHIMGFDLEEPASTGAPRPVAAPHIQEHVSALHLGTYPPWADPSYGFKGGPFRFNFWRQANRTQVVLHGYFDIYFVGLGALVCGLLVLLSGSKTSLFATRFASQFVLWVPALAGLGFYATMRFEPRFLGSYTIGLFAAWTGAIYIDDSAVAVRLTRSVARAVCAMLILQSAVQAGHQGIGLLRHAQHPDWQVANALGQIGLKSGDRVGYMGDALSDHGWAYVAAVKIVAEIPPEDVLQFWAADPNQRKEVLKWLASTGAKALVTNSVPNDALPMGWHRVGDTDYYVLPIPKALL